MHLMMDCAMHTNVNLQADTTKNPTPKTPASVWFGGVAVSGEGSDHGINLAFWCPE
jgi:hypothetical protein